MGEVYGKVEADSYPWLVEVYDGKLNLLASTQLFYSPC